MRFEKELKRIEDMGVRFVPAAGLTRTGSKAWRKGCGDRRHRRAYPACSVARHEIVAGIDFLKAINARETSCRPESSSSSAAATRAWMPQPGPMRWAKATYRRGKPRSLPMIAHIEALGGAAWPVMTKEIIDGDLSRRTDAHFRRRSSSPSANSDLGYLPEGVRKFRDWVIPGADMSLLENVFAAGDVIKPGLLADAIGTGIKAAEAVDASLRGVAYAPVEKKPVPSGQLSTAYFTRCPHGELPAANRDFDRCVSCGTCRDCRMCLESCPEGAISRETLAGGAYRYVSDPDRHRMRHLLRRLPLRHLDDASQCSAGVGEAHGRLGREKLSEESFSLPQTPFSPASKAFIIESLPTGGERGKRPVIVHD
ncbi:MAG: hypothetical protein ACLTTU_12625 [Bilophila wadsworthia]